MFYIWQCSFLDASNYSYLYKILFKTPDHLPPGHWFLWHGSVSFRAPLQPSRGFSQVRARDREHPVRVRGVDVHALHDIQSLKPSSKIQEILDKKAAQKLLTSLASQNNFKWSIESLQASYTWLTAIYVYSCTKCTHRFLWSETHVLCSEWNRKITFSNVRASWHARKGTKKFLRRTLKKIKISLYFFIICLLSDTIYTKSKSLWRLEIMSKFHSS